jgi:hypothetical protein
MPSTYTTNGGIEKIASGEQSGTWGQTTNDNFDIIDRITNGVGSITLSGTSSNLQTADGALSDGQYKVLVLGGTPSGTHTITVLPNNAQKLYFVVNNSGQSVIFDQGSGSNVTIANNDSAIIYCDGGGGSAAVKKVLLNYLEDSDIGSTVLAYDSNLQGFVDAFTLPTSDGTSNYVLATNGSGTISFSERATPAQARGYAISFSLVFGA